MKHVRQLVVDSVVAQTVRVTPFGGPSAVAIGRVRVHATDGDTEVSFWSSSTLAWIVGDRVWLTVGKEQPEQRSGA